MKEEVDCQRARRQKGGERAEVSHALSLSLSLSHVAWNNYITVAAAEEEENYYRNNAQHPPPP